MKKEEEDLMRRIQNNVLERLNRIEFITSIEQGLMVNSDRLENGN